MSFGSDGSEKGGPVSIQLHLALPASDAKAIDEIQAEAVALTIGSWKELLVTNVQADAKREIELSELHNFSIGMNWLPWPILAKRLWPKVKHKSKRAITWEEHQKIIEREANQERRDFYDLCWELGGAQTDVANLDPADVGWTDRTICYDRKKLASLDSNAIKPPLIRFGKRCEAILKRLPQDHPICRGSPLKFTRKSLWLCLSATSRSQKLRRFPEPQTVCDTRA